MHLAPRAKQLQMLIVAGADLRSLLTWPFLLLAAGIIVLMLGGMNYAFYQQKDKRLAQLQAMADFKVQQISAWVRERQGDAQLLHNDRFIISLYQQWRDSGNSASRQQLLQRMDDYRQADDYQDVILIDEQGEPVLALTDPLPRLDPQLRVAVQRAIAEEQALNTDFYRVTDASATLHLDFVAPLRAFPEQPGPAMVLRVDPATVLSPIIQFWPVSGVSAETALFRRDGDQALLLLSALSYPSDTVLKLRPLVTHSSLLEARLLRGEAAQEKLLEGLDYRNMPVIGVGKAIPGVDWLVLVKLDRDEFYAPAVRDIVWIALMGVIMLLAVAIATVLIRQRQKQAEQLRALIARGETEEALRRNQVMLARTEAIAHVGSWEWEIATDTVTWSEGLFRIFQRNPTDQAPTFAEHPELYEPKDMDRLRAAVEKAVKEGVPYELELRTIRQDGAIRVCLAQGYAERGPEQRVMRLFGSLQDITERKEIEDELRQYQYIISSTPDGIALLDPNYRYLIVNRAYERFSGIPREQFVGRAIADYLGQETFEQHIKAHFDRCLQGETIRFEDWFEYKSLGRRCVVVTYFPYFSDDDAIAGVVAATRDVTDQKLAEMALRAALQEETTLLKEVHHRVKNNLQIITSLLNLQVRQIQNPVAQAVLQDTQSRIRSLALLHESLYREGHLGWVDGAAYLSQLCSHLSNSFSLMAGSVRLRHQLAPVALSLDQAVPCGLIVNELISNAFKHAFPGERRGEIRVELGADPDGRLALVVADNGVGLPPDLDYRHSDSLGLQLVVGLSQQLCATLDVSTVSGAMFRLIFPASLPSKASPT